MTAPARAVADRGAVLLRHLAGFALAPAVVPVALLGYEVFRMSAESARSRPALAAFTASPLELAVSFATAWVPASYAVAVTLGVPIVLALRAARRLAVPWVVGVSAGLAAAAAAAGMLVADGAAALEDPEAAILAGLAAGLAAAVSGAYCAIAAVPLRRAPAPPG